MGSSSCHINLINSMCTEGTSTKYHKAARDGNVVALLEGTKRDFNRRDEDGLTPVHWAAYDGKLEALRVATGRGGNADLQDTYGNTPLHYASRNNHLNCVSYLINFGCNVWALDNEGHTALDTAALFDRQCVVKYLDADMASKYVADAKKVERMKSKSLQDAKKRVAALSAGCYGNGKTSATVSKKFCDVFKRIQIANSKESNPNTDTKSGNSTVNSVPSVVDTFQRKRCSSTDVLYNNPNMRRDSVGSLFEINSKLYDRRMGLFERPGLGTVSFRHLDLLSMFPSSSSEDQTSFITHSSSESCVSNSSSCNESLKAPVETCRQQATTLTELLKSYDLIEYLDVFDREKITLDSLPLLKETDFIELNIPMGPRKLLIKAISNLKQRKC